MAQHTVRLIFTVLFLIFMIAGIVSRYWLSALFWALIAFAVGHPFIRNGRIDLHYEDAPTRVVFLQPIVESTSMVTPTTTAQATPVQESPLATPVTGGAPAGLQQLVSGTF
jgi:hypothetical protein